MASRKDKRDLYLNLIKSEYEKCKNDVVYFINHYCVIEDKDAPEIIVPFHGWEDQNKAILSIVSNRLNLILKARQLGMTWVAVYICVHDLLFNVGHTAIALSKIEEDAKELVRRFSVVAEHVPRGFFQVAGVRIDAKTESVSFVREKDGMKSTFKAFPSAPGAARSFTANILMIDEWAFQNYAREIWTSAYPTINRPTGGKVIGLSTMLKGTLFEELWSEKNNFNKIFLSVFADPRRTKEWYKQAEKDLGVKVKQEYPRTAEEALSNLGGSFFHEFDYGMHVCDPFKIPEDWSIYNTMDYGMDMFAHYKIAIDNENEVYVFHEIYESDLIISEAAERVRKAETVENEDGEIEQWYPPRERLAPPDMWNRVQESGKSKAVLFEENGISLTRSNNDREAGWMAIKELLKVTETKGVKHTRLHIFRTCVNLIRTLPQIMIDEKNMNDCSKEPHELTHAPDALRYFAIYWTSAPKKETKKVRYSKYLMEDYLRASDEEKARIIKKHGEPIL